MTLPQKMTFPQNEKPGAMANKGEKLVRVGNYARIIGISRQAVYDRIKRGVVNSVKIDGVLFICIKENHTQNRPNDP